MVGGRQEVDRESSERTREGVIEVLANTLDLDYEEFNREDVDERRLNEDLEMESIDYLDVNFKLERRFGYEYDFKFNGKGSSPTVRDLIDYVFEKLRE